MSNEVTLILDEIRASKEQRRREYRANMVRVAITIIAVLLLVVYLFGCAYIGYNRGR